jgi:hypothetical protein
MYGFPPGAAMAHMAGGGQPMGDLLNDFSDQLDSVELSLLCAGMVLAFGFAFFIIAMLMVRCTDGVRARVAPARCAWRARPTRAPRPLATQIYLMPPPVPVGWYYCNYVSLLLIALSLVYIVEPRPRHWLVWADGVRRAGVGSVGELRLRLRRWWRWRKKYETKTKLNV